MKPIALLLALVLILTTSACALPMLGNSPATPTTAAPPLAGTVTTSPAKSTAAPVQPSPTLPKSRNFIPGVISSGGQPVIAYPPPGEEPSPTPEPSATTPPATRAPGEITRLPPYSPHTGEQHSYENWKKWPVLPVVSQRAIEIYQKGLASGTDPKHFSKVGDCQVIRQYFLGYFDQEDQNWRLADTWSTYRPVLKNFNGSYFRLSMAVRTGFNVASVLSAINSDPANCKAGEIPLACEVRLWNPSIAIVSMETWTKDRPTAAYEGYLRQIVDYLIGHNVLPILATKADNLEGDHSINKMVARVAYEYDIPLWNFWAATDPLPSHGVEADGFHLTNGPSQLVGEGLKIGWNVRNLTALQTLNKVWKEVQKK